ncbi:hypothetical protein PAHAL_3G063500 [Panicum hallii]|uniref:HIT domain-containing protein n=1 Tax=Panicum hallii TaxID=206008 RepID=A0A2T8KHB0_9POAL|nr:hypothetical protein PAHAL_3G063500 [Panicum hallii]
MPPPPGSSAPAPERRLAVLLSHFRPCREAPRAATRLATAERHGTAAAAEAEAVLSASPCAAGGSGSSGGEYCVFCNIIAGAAPAFKLYEDDECVCILDAKPLTPGHSLIIPKSHYPSLQTTPPTVLAAICSKLPLLGTAIMKATQCGRCIQCANQQWREGRAGYFSHSCPHHSP